MPKMSLLYIYIQKLVSLHVPFLSENLSWSGSEMLSHHLLAYVFLYAIGFVFFPPFLIASIKLLAILRDVSF